MKKECTGILVVCASVLIMSHSASGGESAAAVVTAKKGIAMAVFGPGNAAQANASWYYDWGTSPHAGTVPAGLQIPEFVPMIWGAGSVTDNTINTLTAAKNSGTYSCLLGFNEPDNAGQSNMTVAQAIGLWPRLIATGLALGSPAPAYPGAWFDSFMVKAESLSYRVDFICLHYYQPPNAANAVSTLKTWLTNAYNKYHKPIWLTEFGAPDCKTLGWCGASAAPLTQAQVDTYAAQVITMLEDLPYVQRYAWFVDASQSGFELSALFKSDGSLSQTGIDFRDAKGTAAILNGFVSREATHQGLSVYRRADGTVVCRLPSDGVNYRISFFDISGHCISRFRAVGAREVTVEGVRAKGVYALKMESEGASSEVRLLVQ